MGKSSPPPPTPPRETSAAQTGSNVTTAIANSVMGNISENTPDGSTRVDRTGSYTYTDPYTNLSYTIPTFTRNTTLTPQGQAIRTQQDAARQNLSTLAAQQSGFLQDYLARPFDAGALGQAPDAPALQTSIGTAPANARVADSPTLQRRYAGDFAAERARVEDTLMARQQPQLERERSALESRLAQQGIKVGSAAYQAAMDDFGRQSNDARMSAILAGGQEQSRLTGLAREAAQFGNEAGLQQQQAQLAAAGFNNAAGQQDFANATQAVNFANAAALQQFNAASQGRAQTMQEQFALRNQPINEISALISGSQVANPQFQGANIARIPTTDNAQIIQNYDQAQFQRWQAENQMANSMANTVLGGFGSLFRLSDERLKADRKKIATLYEYRMKGDPKGRKRIGVMAQELEKTLPGAVMTGPDGLKRVNYGALYQAG